MDCGSGVGRASEAIGTSAGAGSGSAMTCVSETVGIGSGAGSGSLIMS